MDIKVMKIALLIDAENVSDKYVEGILAEIATNHGTATVKRIYGDWTSIKMKKWKDVLLEHALTPIQQFCYSKGKNSSDSSMIIDAMDILYSNDVDGFCLVTSDSDFTALASRLREAGKYVLGMGEDKTVTAFRAACTQFRRLEIFLGAETKADKENKSTVAARTDAAPLVNVNVALKDKIFAIIDNLSNEEGWANMADIGNALNRQMPEFDARNYGFPKLSQFILSLTELENYKVIPESNKTLTYYYVRKKKR